MHVHTAARGIYGIFLAGIAGTPRQKRNGAQRSDEPVAAEARRVWLGPGQRHVTGDVRGEPDAVSVDQPYLRPGQDPVAVDEGPVGRPLVADRGAATVIDHDRRVPP